MLQRCLKASVHLLTAAEASCGQAAATQVCRPFHTKAFGESLSGSYYTAQHHGFIQHVPSYATACTLSGAATEKCKAGGSEDRLQARCLSSESWSPSRAFQSQQQALHSHSYHRTHGETLTSQHRRTLERSFAKASRLAQPASRAAKKVAQRLPTSRQAGAGTEESSSGQSDLTGQEHSSSDAVVTQAEHSRASDVQVRLCLRPC